MERSRNYQPTREQHHPELFWFGLVALLGVLTRLVFILVFPTQPISDFLFILNFARVLAQDVLAPGSPMWQILGPGTSFFLSLFLRVLPFPPEVVARSLTATLTGLLPLLPFLLWKGVFSLRARVVAALLLALYPAQIIFSGVVAQDNWVLLPVTALGALAVRVVALKSSGHPVWAAVLFAAGFFIRQEMLFVLLPLGLVTMAGCSKSHRLANLLKGTLITVILIGMLVLQRGAATGEYRLTTSHLDDSLLGSYAPSAEMSWLDPRVLVAARAPDLLENDRYKQQAFDLVINEIFLRPGYHAVRILFSPFFHILNLELASAYWGLTAPGVLAGERQAAAQFLVTHTLPHAVYFSYIVHVLFLAGLFFTFLERKWAGAVSLLAAIVLKLGFHALIVSQSRYFLTVYVLEVLLIGSLLDDLLSRQYAIAHLFSANGLKNISYRNVISYLGLGLIATLGIHQSTRLAENYLIRADENTQVTYQFPASLPAAEIGCQMTEGRLLFFRTGSQTSPGMIKMDFLKADPEPGSRVVLTCKVTTNTAHPLRMRIQDTYPNGNYPNRILQVVTINAAEVYRRDIADMPGAGWHDIPLDTHPDGTPLEIQVIILAPEPDAGWQWGRAALTEVQFTPMQPPP